MKMTFTLKNYPSVIKVFSKKEFTLDEILSFMNWYKEWIVEYKKMIET